MIGAGAKMTQMENRIVLARFKDGYGPVGAYFLHLKTYTQNGLGESTSPSGSGAGGDGRQALSGRRGLAPHSSPIPTCLRIMRSSTGDAGRSIHMVTMEAFQDRISRDRLAQLPRYDRRPAVLWAATDVDPKYENPELTTSEPYVMGSHAPGVSLVLRSRGPLPPEYFWATTA